MNHGTGQPVDKLGDDERSCLLRAARAQILKQQDEWNRLETMANNEHGRAAADSAAMELACLQRGIAWLWRTQGPP